MAATAHQAYDPALEVTRNVSRPARPQRGSQELWAAAGEYRGQPHDRRRDVGGDECVLAMTCARRPALPTGDERVGRDCHVRPAGRVAVPPPHVRWATWTAHSAGAVGDRAS